MSNTSLVAKAGEHDLLAGLSLGVRHLPPASLTAFGRKARTHSKDQIAKIGESIRTFGFSVPVIVDEHDKVISGNARVEAAIQLGMPSVPVVTLSRLSTAQKRAFVLAENKLATLGGWDKAVLRLEFEELQAIDLDFNIEATGVAEPEIDAIVFGSDAQARGGKVEVPAGHATSRVGDLWELGAHRLLCGDATRSTSLVALMGSDRARVVFSDPPYNCKVAGHITSSGKFSEFVMASGEMTGSEFGSFLEQSFSRMKEGLIPGGLMYVCMDFRQIRHILDAAERVDLKLLNLIVWDKQAGGMGSFYRSRHELIFLFAVPGEPHLNRVQLGRHGRDRSNVWSYPSVNGFGAAKAREREMHPTVKPLAMVRDALLDSTNRGDVVLDLFSGSGTTLIAAEETGRRARVMDLDPTYVDTAVIRWQDFSGKEARLAGSGKTFREVRAERSSVGGEATLVTAPAAGSLADLPRARVRTRRAA